MIFSGEWIKVWGIRILPFPNICSQNDPPYIFLLVAFNKKKIKKSGSPKNTPYKFGGSVKMQIVRARIKALKIKMFKSSPASMSQDTPTLLYMLYFTAKTSIRDVQVVKGAILIRTIDCFLIFFLFFNRSLRLQLRFLIGKLEMNSKRFISRLIDHSLRGHGNTSAVLWLHWSETYPIFVIHRDIWLDFFITLCDFLEFWIAKGVLPEFCIDIDVFFLRKCFTEVLSAPFYKILLSW